MNVKDERTQEAIDLLQERHNSLTKEAEALRNQHKSVAQQLNNITEKQIKIQHRLSNLVELIGMLSEAELPYD